MAARDSSQVAQKAEILKALFPEELKDSNSGNLIQNNFRLANPSRDEKDSFANTDVVTVYIPNAKTATSNAGSR